MFADISPAAVPAYLRNLVKYAKLSEELRRCPDRDCPSCIELRAQRFRLKNCIHLPNVLNYLNSISNHPPRGCRKPLAAITDDNSCESCGEPISAAWLLHMQQAPFPTCEYCGAILIPKE